MRRIMLRACACRVVRDHQAMTRELALGQTGVVPIEREGIQRPAEFAMAPRRHRQDELQLALRGVGNGGQFGNVVHAQQAAVGNDDHALDIEALEHRVQHRLQRRGLRHVAGVHGMHQRQTFGRLHHAEHELALDAASFLVHAERAEIVCDLALTVNADRGQVVEHHRQLLVEHRPQLRRNARFDGLRPIHQCIHRAQ